MVCNKCGQELAEGVKFCTNCGNELAEGKGEVAEVISEVKEEVAETVEDAKEAVAEAVSEVKEEVAEVKEDVAEVAAEVKEEVTEAAAEVKENVEEAVAEGKEKVAEAKEKVKEKKEQKPFDKKWLAIVAIVLLIFIPAAVSLGGDAEYIGTDKKSVVELMNTSEDGVKVVFADGTIKSVEIEKASSAVYSQDHSVACFQNEDGEWMLIRDGKVETTKIEDANNLVMSTYGDTIAYLTDVEYDLATFHMFGTLQLYYTKNGKTKEIAEDVLVGSVVLSPNGETVAYVSDYDAADDFKGYYSIKGKEPVEVGKEKQVFAIADKAKFIYYRDDDRIYAQKKKKDGEKLASDLGSVSVYLNADCSEILFNNDGKTYMSVKAGEKEKVSGETIRNIVLPSGAYQGYQSYSMNGGGVYVNYTGVETLEEQLYYNSEYEVVYLDGKGNTESVTSAVWENYYMLSDDGKELVYIDYDWDVVRVTDFKDGGKETEVGKEDAEALEFYAAGDLKYIYYVNDDDELWCIKGKKAKKLADDVTSVAVSDDGKMCYYVIEGETLCYSKKNGKKKEIDSSDEGGFICSNSGNQAKFRISNDDVTAEYIMDGKKMKEIYSVE